MAIEVERLVATLEARLDKYEKGVAKARALSDKQFTAIEKRGTRMEASLARTGGAAFLGFTKGAIGALLPVLSVAAAVNKAKQAMAEFGNIADNAAATGLDPEFYQSLTYQVGLFGVSVEQSAGALATFAKNSGLAVAGKGRMFTALKTLNPALLENIRNARNQEERVRLVADALNGEEDAAKRAAIATAAFGESGAKIAQGFEGGAAAIDATMQKAKALGLIVERDLIARADELGDEFETTVKILDTQVKQALVNLGPILVWLTGLAGGFAETAGFMIDALKPENAQQLGTLVKELNALKGAANSPNPLGLPRDIFGVDAARMRELEQEIFRRGEKRSMERLKTTAAPVTDDIPSLDDLENAKKGVQDLHSSYDAWKDDGVQGLIDKHQELAETMSGAVVDGVQSIWEAFKNGENVLDAILGKALSLGEQLAFGGLQSLLTGAIGGNLGGGWNIPTAHKPGGFFPAFPGRASGGPVSAGRPYIVGEKRPELFVPSSAGRIVPRIPSGATAGGGQVNNFHIDARGAEIGVEAKIVQAIRTMVPPMIKSQAPAAMGQASRDRTYG